MKRAGATQTRGDDDAGRGCVTHGRRMTTRSQTWKVARSRYRASAPTSGSAAEAGLASRLPSPRPVNRNRRSGGNVAGEDHGFILSNRREQQGKISVGGLKDDKSNNGVDRSKSDTGGTDAGSVLGLLDLPVDARLRIIQFLHERTELPSYTCVSKQCVEDRNHPSLSHIIRWAKLLIPPKKPVIQILQKLVAMNQAGVFDNFCGLYVKYESIDDNLTAKIADVKYLLKSIKLSKITHLIIESPKRRNREGISTNLWYARIPNCIPSFLSKITPCLQYVELKLYANQYAVSNFFSSNSSKSLETFKWYGSRFEIHLDGRQLKKCRTGVFKHLVLDDCIFQGAICELRDPERFIKFLHHIKDAIETLSIPNISCWFWDTATGRATTARIPQASIYEFLLGAPCLRHVRLSHSVLSSQYIHSIKTSRPNLKVEIVKSRANGMLDTEEDIEQMNQSSNE